MTAARGAFIVLEGIDGAGTTTQAERLVSRLRARGRAAHLTREPSAGPVGVLIRQALSKRLVVPSPSGPRAPGFATMALLFAADRMDHLESEVLPRLERGEVVVSDRYDYSSLVYQSATSDAPEETARWVRELNRHARRPDLVLVLDLPAELAKRRREGRGEDEEIFDADPLQRRLAEGYRSLAAHFPEDAIELVDAALSIEEVEAVIAERVGALLGGAPKV